MIDRIGRYKIVRELGRGAMGVVYLATDPTIGRSVAIKTIRLGELTNADERARLRERLFREARSAGVLSHPGIVTIYDMEAQDDLAFIAMEYVNGPTLEQLLSGGSLAPERLFSILAQTASALDYAHQKGIVHRDIKPANIMITEDDVVKITDFGIAKINTSEQFTMTGSIVGTPHYMAPEQVQGLPVDGRADQFSFAVIVFEMLTGEKPFTGEQLTTVVYKIVAEEPAPPHRLNSTLNQGITNVLRKALTKKPESRYATCQQFIEALEAACTTAKGWKPLARGGGMSLPTEVEVRRPEPQPLATTEEAQPRQGRRMGIVPVFLAVIVAAALVGLIAWQAAPWLTDSRSKQGVARSTPPSNSSPPPAPAEKKAASSQSIAPPQAAEAGEETARKSEPEPARGPIPEEPAPAAPPRSSAAARQAARRPAPDLFGNPYLKISVSTDPADATAMLDNRPDTACTTPCALDAAPGRHMVSFTLKGFQTEHREVEVHNGDVQVSPVKLRPPGGVLMLTSDPVGADIFVNGSPIGKRTPSPLQLAPGKYTITIQMDGKRASKDVEITDGSTRYEKILMSR